eukprot:2743496-Lingulodinium_polyedra.AAC.1
MAKRPEETDLRARRTHRKPGCGARVEGNDRARTLAPAGAARPYNGGRPLPFYGNDRGRLER